MTNSAPAEAPSTATVQPVPEQAPPKANLSVAEMIDAKVKALEKSPVEEVKKAEGTEQAQEKPADDKEATVTSDPETVSYGGKDIPVADLFNEMEFEVFANGEYKPVDGAKLLDMASIGFAATKKIESAKEIVTKANEVVKELEANAATKAQQIAANYLNNLLDQVTNGRDNPATGKPFQTQVERQKAVDLANSLIDANAKSATPEQPMTRAEYEKMIEEKLEQKLKLSQEDKAKQAVQQEAAKIAQTAESSLQKAIEPLMQYFTGEDGKTVNSLLFEGFQNHVRSEADKLWKDNGKPNEQAKIDGLLLKAAKTVLDKYRPSLKAQAKQEQTKVPVTPTGSGMPVATKNGKSNYKGMSLEQAVQAKLKGLSAQISR